MARQTSIDAYNQIRESGLLGKRHWQIYNIIYEFGPMTSTEVIEKYEKIYGAVAKTGGMTTRCTELVRSGVTEEVGQKENPISGMNQYLYDVTGRLPGKREKRKTKDEIILELQNRIKELEQKLYDVAVA